MLSVRIALRYLFARKSHNAVNIISMVSMVGVAVATAAIICVLSVFNGFSNLSMERLSAINPELKIESVKGKVIYNADSVATVVKKVVGVSEALPVIDEQALAMYRNRQMPVRLIGLPAEYCRVVDLDRLIIDGELNLDASTDSAMRFATLSIGVATRLGARPGYFDWFAIYAPRRKGRINTVNPMTSFVSDSLAVGGVYEALESKFDASTMIVPMTVAQRLFDYTTEATTIHVAVAKDSAISTVAKKISENLGGEFRVLTRLQQQEDSFRMIAIEKWITFAMLGFIFLIAAFNVVSTLSMLILEKQDNIATMRSLGATNSSINRIFIIEGWLITMVGAVVGIIVGIILSLAQQYGGFIKLNGDPSQLTITEYPVQLQPLDGLIVFALAAVIGLIVGIGAAAFIPKK